MKETATRSEEIKELAPNIKIKTYCVCSDVTPNLASNTAHSQQINEDEEDSQDTKMEYRTPPMQKLKISSVSLNIVHLNGQDDMEIEHVCSDKFLLLQLMPNKLRDILQRNLRYFWSITEYTKYLE